MTAPTAAVADWGVPEWDVTVALVRDDAERRVTVRVPAVDDDQAELTGLQIAYAVAMGTDAMWRAALFGAVQVQPAFPAPAWPAAGAPLSAAPACDAHTGPARALTTQEH